MIRATPNETLPLAALVTDNNSGLFCEARIYDGSGSFITNIDLTYQTDGLYVGSWIPSVEGYYTAVYSFFYDAAKTVAADDEYPKAAEQIEVTADKTNLLRILGLLHENAVLDQTTYNSEGNLLTGRLRVYDTKANATAAGTAGLLFSYTIEATYNAGLLQTYKILKDQ